MAGFSLKLALVLVLGFMGLIGLIHAQPYDDGQLRAFLTPPEGCPMPCWLGIRPGVTTVEEAIAILEQHPWVGAVEQGPADYRRIQWSGQQPTLVDDQYPGILLVDHDVVTRIRIPVQASFGDFWLQFNRPPQGNLLFLRGQPFAHFANYPENGFTVRVPVHCPPAPAMRRLWQEPALVLIGQLYMPFEDYAFTGRLQRLPCRH